MAAKTRYKVRRGYARHDDMDMIAQDLTLKQAQDLCKKKESSSSSCTRPELNRLTQMKGPWFLQYTAMTEKEVQEYRKSIGSV